MGIVHVHCWRDLLARLMPNGRSGWMGHRTQLDKRPFSGVRNHWRPLRTFHSFRTTTNENGNADWRHAIRMAEWKLLSLLSLLKPLAVFAFELRLWKDLEKTWKGLWNSKWVLFWNFQRLCGSSPGWMAGKGIATLSSWELSATSVGSGEVNTVSPTVELLARHASSGSFGGLVQSVNRSSSRHECVGVLAHTTR